MSNSPLVNYTCISPHKNSPRNHKIDTITIHCMAGNCSIETCGNLFKNRPVSSNYGIGSDGRIALYVDEKDRSWGSSNGANDHRAVTIEVANDGGAETGWHVSDKALHSLINLCADICKRNGIKELKWKADKSLIGQVDKQNMTVHRWFASKACPGDYLYKLHYKIAKQVNKKLNAQQKQSEQNIKKPINIYDLTVTNVGQIGLDILINRFLKPKGYRYKFTKRQGNIIAYDVLVTNINQLGFDVLIKYLKSKQYRFKFKKR